SLKGTLSSDPAGDVVEVQFDANGDGQPDAEAFTDMQGNFSFVPSGLNYGSVTIAARTVAHGAGPLTYSAWVSLTFAYEAPPAQAPGINDFRLANDDGASAADNVTTDPTVTGTVAYDSLSAGGTLVVPTTDSILSGSVEFLKVEFDFDGDGTADASTTTGPGGTFTYKPTGLAYGSITIRARAIGRDGQNNPIDGDWTSLTFTFNPPAANVAAVSSLTLANPT